MMPSNSRPAESVLLRMSLSLMIFLLLLVVTATIVLVDDVATVNCCHILAAGIAVGND